jgi:adenylosuccinate lyase
MSDVDRTNYQSPLSTRYASAAMRANFSDQRRCSTWRRIWIELARAERELGLPIQAEQIAELEAHAQDIDFAAAARHEQRLRHDVMAHVHAWGEQCPAARPIIHLGATSCDITDNADLIVLRDGLELLRGGLVETLRGLREFAWKWRAEPTLGWTHFQPAQATTIGKRACLWLQDLLLDLDELERARDGIRFKGVRGATGTQASFLELFAGDEAKVQELERRVMRALGFTASFAVCGQTYPRQLDFRLGAVLSGIAQSAHKFAVDVRLLASRRELEEPFEEAQIGSSAMPWKRNPMRCERICGLARFVIEALGNTAHTAANQWLERTLDDSANRRLALSEMFLATDAVLALTANVARGLVVHPLVARRNLMEELPFLASEHLLMEAVKAGGDRQLLHERLRVHSRDAARAIKEQGLPNPLRERLAADPAFAGVSGSLGTLLDPSRYVGRAPAQVEEFLRLDVDQRLARLADVRSSAAKLEV